ncbi:MAG: fibrillarin-like rRNA/tRNA 2'-O-methyltransferase [Thermoplasmata archaeon]|nr:fibrillarin-like rRNA/tRNA 2'-O-methyltransferase [Thermoplasmata archaeon]
MTGPSESTGPLWLREEEGRQVAFTAGLGTPPAVYGERVIGRGGRQWRRWDPTRSKLGAAVVKGWDDPLPRVGERWLYLGAATGTTASHVADLVGPSGAVYAVERSLRPFTRLLANAEHYPNLLPILADARTPGRFVGDVPIVDGLYLDIAQPDQLEIALTNAAWFLRDRGALLFAVKTASMGRERSPQHHLQDVVQRLESMFEVRSSLSLEPMHRRHFLVGARRGAPARPRSGALTPRRPVGRPGRRPR